MSDISRERREVVILGGSIAAMSATVAALQHNHPWLAMVWMGSLFLVAVYVMVKLIKIKRKRRAK